jgi:2-polyprenyl-3-methyl-5-hydroxy-6-metoxy-1,4-benzoquinol methylase
VSSDASIARHRVEVDWRYRDIQKRDAMMTRRVGLVCEVLGHRPLSVLDVGCGDGSFLGMLGDAKRRLGIDINAEIPPSSSFEYRSLPIEELSEDERFEVVTSFHSLEHISDAVGAAKKMARLAESVLAIEIPTRRRMKGFYGHAHMFTERSLKAMLSIHCPEFAQKRLIPNVQGSSLLWIGKRK